MRKPSIHLSETFLLYWGAFSKSLSSEHTKANYFSNICNLCDTLSCDFFEITQEQAVGYFEILHKRGFSIKTMYSKLGTFRSMGNFILEHREISEVCYYVNVFSHVSLPGYELYLGQKDIMKQEEIAALFQTAISDSMLHLIFRLCYRCSLTASEICSLRVEQLGMDGGDSGFILFYQGEQKRYVKVPDDVMEEMITYIKKRSIEEWLFLNRWHNPLTPRNLQLMFRKACREAGLSEQYTLQTLRNTSLAYMLTNGAKEEQVADHAGIQSRWMIRYHKVIEELKDSPVDRLASDSL